MAPAVGMIDLLRFDQPRGRAASDSIGTFEEVSTTTGAIVEVLPAAAYQSCTVRFYCNALSKVSGSKRGKVTAMLKAVHAQEPLDAGMKKGAGVVEKLEDMRLAAPAKCVRGASRRRWVTYNLLRTLTAAWSGYQKTRLRPSV